MYCIITDYRPHDSKDSPLDPIVYVKQFEECLIRGILLSTEHVLAGDIITKSSTKEFRLVKDVLVRLELEGADKQTLYRKVWLRITMK